MAVTRFNLKNKSCMHLIAKCMLFIQCHLAFFGASCDFIMISSKLVSSITFKKAIKGNENFEFLKQDGAILISGILGPKLCHAAFDGNILKLDSMLSNNPKYIGKVNIADYDHRTALHLVDSTRC